MSKARVSEEDRKCGARLQDWLRVSAPSDGRRPTQGLDTDKVQVVARQEVTVRDTERVIVRAARQCDGEDNPGVCQSDRQVAVGILSRITACGLYNYQISQSTVKRARK